MANPKAALFAALLTPSATIFAEERPNIVFLITEDLSPVFGCYGGQAITPNIDELASRGTIYNRVYSAAPISAPSRSCLMTGVYPTSTGTQHLRMDGKIPASMKSLPEVLSEKGYFTSNRNKTDYNFTPEGRWHSHTSSLTPWRERVGNQPFYAFINIGSTHEGVGNSHTEYAKVTAGLSNTLRCNPDTVRLPLYFPNTPEMRRIYAQYIDLASALDTEIGKVIKSIEDDGLSENTIIIIASDHGTGLPRHKRWLNVSGLHVPFIVYLPDKYKHPEDKNSQAGNISNELIGLIDYAPTVLSLAGIEQPDYMQGRPFLGKHRRDASEYIFASRSRADDMYEISRAVITRDYIYVRHYLPFHPYIPSSIIFSDEKTSLKELRRNHALTENQRKRLSLSSEEQIRMQQNDMMWRKKPVEELYDLRNDPNELTNLASNPSYDEIKNHLHAKLAENILNTRDAGFLMEPEMLERSLDATVYEMAQDTTRYNLPDILKAAEMIGFGSEKDFLRLLESTDSGERFWGVMGLRNSEKLSGGALRRLRKCLKDSSLSVQIAAAEILCLQKPDRDALAVLKRALNHKRLYVKLYAARSIEQIGKNASPLIPAIKAEIDNLTIEKDEKGQRIYKDFNWASFTEWALESALLKNGVDCDVQNKR